jgi:hypothetical protein
MNKAQLFKWNLINNDVNEIINNIPKSEKELAKVMSNPITTFYFNDKFLIEKIKKSKVSAVLKKNVNSNHYKELSIN